MSFWKSLFGGGGAAESAEKATAPVEYNGYMISAAPYKAEGQYQTAGTITKDVGGTLKGIRHDYANFNWIMSGGDTFVCEGTSYGEHEDGPWRAGVTHAGRWCDVFEVRDFLIQRCFIYLDPDYAGSDTDRYPWLSADGRDASQPLG